MSTASPRSFEGRAERLRRNWLLLGFTLCAALLGLGCILFGPRGYGPIGGFGVFWGGVMSAIVAQRSPFPRRLEQAALADASGLSLAGRLELRRDQIAQAYIQPGVYSSLGSPGAVVRVIGRGAPDVTLVARLDDAEAILAALGLDTSSRTAAILGRSPLALARVGPMPIVYLLVLVFALSYVALIFAPAAGLGVLVALLYWLLSAVPCRVHVGADGVLRSWLGLRTFVAYREVARVEGKRPRRVDVTLHKLDGSRVELAARRRFDPEAGQGADDRALLHRIEEGLRAHKEAASSADVSALLERGGAGAAAWLEQIRAVCATKGTGYRGSALSEERLLRVVEDPSAPPTLRAGAAVALAVSSGEEDRWRGDLHRVAGACAHPKVRVVLERLAKSEGEGEWVEALEGVGESAAQRGSRADPR